VKSRTFHTLWTKYAGNAAQRDDRLSFCARMLGRAVDSTKELSDDDFDMLIKELRKLMLQGSGRVVSMKGGAVTGASSEQQWKIRQLEAYLGWKAAPERLSGFLREKYHVERPEQLSARDAWRVIESLFGIAAAGFKGAAKRAEVKRLKGVMQTWRDVPASA
jgi:hypothetical protein